MSVYPLASRWASGGERQHNTTIQLVCLPYAGGGAWIFRGWGAALGPGIDVVPVQLPGHGNRIREPLITRLESLVEAVITTIGHSLRPPYAIFGHSMGALLAFELARRLRRAERPSPLCLFVSGHSAPHVPDNEEPLHRLEDHALIERLRELNGTPDAVFDDEELCQLLLPIIRADFQLRETYRYIHQEPLCCPIIAYRGSDDERTSEELMAGWREQTTDMFSMRTLPGDHFFIHSAEGQLLADLRSTCELACQGRAVHGRNNG